MQSENTNEEVGTQETGEEAASTETENLNGSAGDLDGLGETSEQDDDNQSGENDSPDEKGLDPENDSGNESDEPDKESQEDESDTDQESDEDSGVGETAYEVEPSKCYADSELPEYRCHKKVKGFKITEIEKVGSDEFLLGGDEGLHATVNSAWMSRHSAVVGGYFVMYQDGYISYSPSEAFESGYHQEESINAG